jgi:hypothetical protein
MGASAGAGRLIVKAQSKTITVAFAEVSTARRWSKKFAIDLSKNFVRNQMHTVVDLADFCSIPHFMSSRKQKALTLEVKAIIRVHLPLSYSSSQ